ncbi:MAG: hypothetical protein QXG00_08100, partial [Candidatus Woesearchaeota archaeon]
MISIFKIVGIIGLILIIIGVIVRKRKERDYFYILSGVFLEIYSIFIGDIVFIILQAVFTLVVIY